MKSRTAARASLEVKRIDKWWRANRDYENVFADEFESTVQAIEDNPYIGRPYRAARQDGVRYLLMRSTRYHVFYIVEHDEVLIVSVWSAIRGRGPKL